MKYGNFMESMVYNRMNETNLEYIGIFGLFGRYDIEIPFDKQVNIFIGENGLGKTTILNCIYFLLEKKFSRLANIQFSEIRVKFKRESKIHKITPIDVREYNKKSRHRFNRDYEFYSQDLIRHYIYHNYEKDLSQVGERELDLISYELARNLDMPVNEARYQLFKFFDEDDVSNGKKRKGNEKKVQELFLRVMQAL